MSHQDRFDAISALFRAFGSKQVERQEVYLQQTMDLPEEKLIAACGVLGRTHDGYLPSLSRLRGQVATLSAAGDVESRSETTERELRHALEVYAWSDRVRFERHFGVPPTEGLWISRGMYVPRDELVPRSDAECQAWWDDAFARARAVFSRMEEKSL